MPTSPPHFRLALPLRRGIGAVAFTFTLVCGAPAAAGESAFALPVFPVEGATSQTARIGSVLDHSGSFFYTNCCDTSIVAFTGDTANREDGSIFCPAEPVFPECLLGCQCAYRSADGTSFPLDGLHTGYFGNQYLSYDGHPGYDFDYPAGTNLLATLSGQLCKAGEDPINGHAGSPSGWDKFHAFYIDHGTFSGVGYASWYLHADDLVGAALQALSPSECAPVVTGAVVATIGNQGTFVPHLHFEVRTYVAADGPEAGSTRIIDPYGWSGAQPDPFSLPDGNVSAESRTAPVWAAPEPGRATSAVSALFVMSWLRRWRRSG